jgi:hypothetical protein
LKTIWTALLCVTASTALAQMGDYLGPGILSRGVGDIGTSSGQPLSFRFYVTAAGVYDTELQPFAVNSSGDLVKINGAYGEQLDFGAFGVDNFRTARLGLDYRGNIYNYANASAYDGSTHSLSLGYTWQKSRHLVFDLRAIGGTTNIGYGVPGYYGENTTTGPTTFVGTPTSILFDNRMYYGQGTADMTYVQSQRLSYTVGGDGFVVHREAAGLAGVNGYNLRGSIRYRLSKTKTVGVTYEHIAFSFPPTFGQSTSNVYEGFFATSLGRRWSMYLSAGAYQSEVSGIQQIALNPVIAALLGTSSAAQAFYSATVSPSGTLRLDGRYKNFAINLTGGKSVMPGNGLYLTSSQTSALGSFSYTAVRKWNFGVSGGYFKLDAIGQGLQPYSTYSAGAGFTYALTHAVHLVGRYDFRHQGIQSVGYREDGSRATFGLSFSPGNIPLSLW